MMYASAIWTIAVEVDSGVNVTSFITAVMRTYDVLECVESGLSGRVTPKLSHYYERNAGTSRVSFLVVGLQCILPYLMVLGAG
jgi:hypothetical protein